MTEKKAEKAKASKPESVDVTKLITAMTNLAERLEGIEKNLYRFDERVKTLEAESYRVLHRWPPVRKE